eukprot:4389387-Prymnesium_polylepis.1
MAHVRSCAAACRGPGREGRRPCWAVTFPLRPKRLCSVACAYGRDGPMHHRAASLGVILTLMCTGCD